MSKTLRVLGLAVVILMTSAVVHAEPFTILPNGDLVFNTSLSTAGTFIRAQPPQYHYSAIIYTMRVFPLVLPTNGSEELVADVGVVPEPASMVLAGTGLIAAFFRRRKRT